MIEKILCNIDDIMGRIRTHPEYSLAVSVQYLEYLKKEADKHSCSIELEEMVNDIRRNKKESQRYPKKCYSSLIKARDFLGREGISLYSLSQLGHIIQPFKDGKETPKNFRKTDLQFGGFAAPNPEKVPYLINNLVSFLKQDSTVHPVMRAIEAHLRMVQIHPYVDGNGRAARLLQNFCLEERGYPPAIIYSSDREHYINVLRNTLEDRFSHKSSLYNPSSSEELFHSFIASKVLRSAQELENRLMEKRVYEVCLSKVQRGTVVSIQKALQGLRNKKDKPLTISFNKKVCDGKQMIVKGNISKEELDNFFKKMHEKYGIKYNIRCITR